jgi:hypothetical protein
MRSTLYGVSSLSGQLQCASQQGAASCACVGAGVVVVTGVFGQVFAYCHNGMCLILPLHIS